MNNVVMIGRLTKNPELRYAGSNNTALCKFSIAVDRPFAKKEDEIKADFFNVSVWGKIAEICSKHLKKGRKVAIRGRFQNNDYTDKDGVKRYTVELVAEQVDIIDWGDSTNKEESTIIEEDFEENVEKNIEE
jgi:single-strand binding protein